MKTIETKRDPMAVTYHISKSNCFDSSRILLQSCWENQNSSFVHQIKFDIAPHSIPEFPCTMRNILLSMKHAAPNRQICLVFHAQATLPLLVSAYALRRFFGGRNTIFVYDIHDLLEAREYRSLYEKIRYGIIRYRVLRWLERLAVRLPHVRTMTVSDGLAKTIAKRYVCKYPLVVHSIISPPLDPDAQQSLRRHSKALLFFGTRERFPTELIGRIAEIGFELHVYGRFPEKQQKDNNACDPPPPPHVKFFGSYSYNDLSFLTAYRYLILFKPEATQINFRYSLPNKFFQSLAYGISVVLSENFEEMIELSSSVPGVCQKLSTERELRTALTKLEATRVGDYWYRAHELARDLHEQARKRYLQQVRDFN